MGKRDPLFPNGVLGADSASLFPDTQVTLLKQAAAGQWQPFLERYMRPCWREIVILSRMRGIDLEQTEDMFQELMLRIMSDGRFNKSLEKRLVNLDPTGEFGGNLPARYLKTTEFQLQEARFRGYLKGAIINVVREAMRRRSRGGRQVTESQLAEVEPWIEQSLSMTLDNEWLVSCVNEAAMQLRRESVGAKTKGRRRWFDLLYLAAVRKLPPERIAKEFGVSRPTISSLLSQARARFVALLQQATGESNAAELKRILHAYPEALERGLIAARQQKSGGSDS